MPTGRLLAQLGVDPKDLDWQEQSACLDKPLAWFFPKAETGGSVDAAKQLCRSCDVRTECLEYALIHEHFGVWGGKSARERARIRRQRRLAQLSQRPWKQAS